MTYFDPMVAAYVEAIYFTETGDSEQPPADAELHPLTKAEAHTACSRFREAARELGVDVSHFTPERIGHDLWLTRNGHGTGFWDRPEIYGNTLSRQFSALAKAMGQHDADFLFEPEPEPEQLCC